MTYTKKILNALAKTVTPEPLILYHGTTKDRLPKIKRQGLLPSHGWGWAGTKGVYLTKYKDVAKYWAKLRFLGNLQEKGDENVRMEDTFFDRKFGDKSGELLSILQVTIPPNKLSNLFVDMEQAEDVGFSGEDSDWELSLKEIGDVRYNGKIPPNWIRPIK